MPHPFDYLPPDGAAVGPDWIGCRVRAPFGRQELVGVVVETGPPAGDPDRLRPIAERLDREPLTTPELWETSARS
jgi:primosomal protein N' (replication factor Y)